MCPNAVRYRSLCRRRADRRPRPAGPAVYYVHGYYAAPTDAGVVAAEADYAAAAVWRDNVAATQFHPEKSQDVGLMMLQDFAGMGLGAMGAAGEKRMVMPDIVRAHKHRIRHRDDVLASEQGGRF